MGPALQAASSESDAAEPHSFPNTHVDGINHHSRRDRTGGGPPRRLNILYTADVARLNAARSGERAHAARLAKDISGTVWTACRLLTCDEAEARQAFAEAMKALTADRFARLGAYSGRGSLATFVALSVRDLMAEHMLRLLQSDHGKAWHAFERLFEADIVRLIRKRLRSFGEDAWRDAYQDICLKLIDDDYRRLRAYGGTGSFAGFVLRTVDRLLIDLVRGVVGRRRPFPKTVSMEQLEAIANDHELSPEESLIHADDDHRLAAAVEALTEAMHTLPAAERLYLAIVLRESKTPPAREIARLMQRPVEEIYKLKQRVLQKLREIASTDSKIKTWRTSV
jgi:RNA polymerase sigma factor (sigma-70 family)